MADAGVDRVAPEDDASRFQFSPCRFDVVDVQGDGDAMRLKLDPERFARDQRNRDRAGFVLGADRILARLLPESGTR